jgi:hypothetical protein
MKAQKFAIADAEFDGRPVRMARCSPQKWSMSDMEAP